MAGGDDLGSMGIWQRAAVAAAIGLAVVSLFTLKLNTDVGWFLFLAERVAAGESLYVDRVEINLPWIVYLSRVPTTLAQWLDVSSVAVFRSFVLLATLASVTVTTARLSSRSGRGPSAWLIAAWLWLVLLWMAGSDIGEREHLLALALVPYVALRASGLEPPGRTTAVLVGLCAGAALSLKPHFVPVWLAIEVERRLAGFRWGRPETVTAGVVLGISLALLPLLHSQYFDLIREYGALYRGFRHTPLWQLVLSEFLPVLVIVAAILAGMRDREFSRATRGFLVAAMATLVVAIFQGKGFTYHFLPTHVFAGILLLLLMVYRLPFLKAGRHARILAGPLMAAALCLYVVHGGSLHRWSERADAATFDSLVGALRDQSDNGSLLVLSIRMPDIFPLVNIAQVDWASRYNSMWPIRTLYEGEGSGGPEGEVEHRQLSEMGAAESRFLRDVVDDLVTYRPRILMVDEEFEPALGGRFDYLHYLEQDSAAFRELARYEPGQKLGRLRMYRRLD